MSCGVVKPSNPRPPLILGLKPKPRPIITYEKDRGDHGSPKKKPRREQLCPWLAKAKVGEKLLTDKCNLPKPPKEKDKYNK